jgi:Arc/MetJ family transcription regulator
VGVRKTTLEIDEQKLADAAEALGTKTLKETVERSLEEVIAHAARQRWLERYSQPTDLANDEVIRQAWRE